MSSTVIGNSFAVLPTGAGFDVYSASTMYPDASPTVTIHQDPSQSTDFDDTVKTTIMSGVYRYTMSADYAFSSDLLTPTIPGYRLLSRYQWLLVRDIL